MERTTIKLKKKTTDRNKREKIKILLHSAIINNKVIEFERLLLDSGDVNQKNIFGEPLLCTAVFFGNLKAIEILIKAGADINQTDNNGTPILHYAIAQLPITQSLNVINTLISLKNININQGNRYGDTPLHLVVEQRNLRAVKALLAAGADSTQKNNRGITPLQLAQKIHDADIVKELSTHHSNLLLQIIMENIDFLSPFRFTSQSKENTRHNRFKI
jgi:cytohesin